MKLGRSGVEGSADEFVKVINEGGLDITSFLNLKSSKEKIISPLWLLITLILFVFVSCLLWIIDSAGHVIAHKILVVIDLVLIFAMTWLCYLVWNSKKSLALIPLVGGLTVFCICLGVITPENAAKELKEQADSIAIKKVVEHSK